MARDSVFSYYVTAIIEKWRPCFSRCPQLVYQAQLNIGHKWARKKPITIENFVIDTITDRIGLQPVLIPLLIVRVILK